MTSSTTAAMQCLQAADGHEFDCWIQSATKPRQGGLVILQEIFGVTEQLKGVAKRYAAQGLEVAIPALFDRKQRNAVIPFDEAPRGRAIMLSTDLNETMADVGAAMQTLASNGGNVAVIGFCWGGGLALRAAQVLTIAGAVSFYGTRLPSYMDKPLKAPMQFHFGTRDDHSPPEIIEQTRTTFPDAEIFLYQAGHAFANDARSHYVGDAAELAHERTTEFLGKVLA